MRVFAFVVAVAVAVCFAVVNAQAPEPNYPPPAPAPAPLTVPYDSMPSLKQPEPVTSTEKSANTFQPLLIVGEKDCLPYPAVNDAGQVSSGLPSEGADCHNSGSRQVYARSTWFDGVWAIMYAWFFPAVNRAEWEHIIVWINNPNASSQHALYISSQKLVFGGYGATAPNDNIMSDSHVHVIYTFGRIAPTPSRAGESQDLIMWHQLSDAAEKALNNFVGGKVPINDNNFLPILREASPFD